MDRPRVAFLIGSGISRPAGLPGIDEITQLVLCGDRYVRHTQGTYHRLSPDCFTTKDPILGRPEVELICHLLKNIKEDIDRYWKDQRIVDYEDLYYAVRQVHDDVSGERENPLVEAFRARHEKHIAEIMRNSPSIQYDPSRIWEESSHYIHDVVVNMLRREHQTQTIDYLNVFIEATNDPDFARIDFYTLNHDTLLETYLRNKRIEFVDGFAEKDDDGYRWWSPDVYEDDSVAVRFLKLHGSVDWWIGQNSRPVIPIIRGARLDGIYRWRPLLLIGTHDKVVHYTVGAFADLFCLFRTGLKRADKLTVCGYGFGDKGINTQIVEWLSLNPSRRMMVIDPSEDLYSRARGAIQTKFDEGRVRHVKQKLEALRWQDIRE